MSISNAIAFLTRVQEDNDFRRSCYQYPSRNELMEYLSQEGYKFSELEFENSINHLLIRCSDPSQAYEVNQLQNWFNLFAH